MRILEHELERGKELKELLEKLILNGNFFNFFYLNVYLQYLEQIYADKSSGRLSAPPQFNLSSPTNIFDTKEVFSTPADNEIYGSRPRGVVVNRLIQNLPSKPISSAQQYQYDIKPDGTVLRMRCPTCGAEKFRSMLGFLNHCRIHCKLTFSNQEDRLQRCGVPVLSEEIPFEFKNLSHSLIQKSMELAQICVDVQPTKIVEDFTPEIKVIEDEPVELIDFGINLKSFQNIVRPPMTSESIADNRHSHFKVKKNFSRYYIKKEIIVGNISRCLLGTGEVCESVGGRPATHFFKLFIRDVNFRKKNSSNSIDPEDDGILKHIKFVRFFLHPAYKPNDVIDVYEHPFTIEKPAWGEFLIRIQLHFFDDRNKPIDLVHLLSVFSSTSSRYDQGVERLHEIEIDRNTDFNLFANNQSYSSSEILDSESEQSDSDSITSVDNISQASYFGSPNKISAVIGIDAAVLKYCRYCGVPHMPQNSFEIIQKNCAHKPRKIRLNSRTLPSQLFTSTNMLVQEFQPPPKNIAEVGIHEENETFVTEKSVDFVKFVASCAKLLDLPHFLPTERTSFVIAAATKTFLKTLISKSSEQIPAPGNRAALDQKSPSVLTPLHVFQAVTSEPIKTNNNPQSDNFNNFDFLSNAYFSASMGPAKPV